MRLFFSIICLILFSTLYAQGSLTVSIKILEKGGSPYSGAKVTLKEVTGLAKLELVTNSSGVVTTKLEVGKEWNIFINGFQSRKSIEMPEAGHGEMSMTETYNPELFKRLSQQVYSRKGFTELPSNFVANQVPPKGEGVITIEVVNRSDYAQKNIKVGLVDVNTKTVLTATTDSRGKARFFGKLGATYDIDVANVLNIGFTDLPTLEGIEVTETIRYEAPSFVETRSNDTIRQNLKGIIEPPSGYQYFKLEVLKNGGPGAHELVYVWDVKGTEVYTGVTDENGILELMLPIRRKYMIDFEFEKDVDVVDLSQSYGRSTRAMTLTYIPNPRLEHPELFIPKPEQLFLKNFQTFTNKQFPKTKKVGIHARFLGKVNAKSKEAVLEIGINTNWKPAAPPLNISIVIDKSGSMAGYDRIERLKESLMLMISRLPADATISIMAYDDVAFEILPPQKIGSSAQKINALINEIQPGGGTSMLDAMNKAYQFVKQNYRPTAVNKVILMSDGWDANEVSILENAQKLFPEIECSTVGIGESFNYALLSILANNGKGKLFYVNSPESYDSVFVKGMIANLSPVATDVTIEVEFNNQIVFKHLYGFKPILESSNPAVFKLPNLYSESTEIALAKFDLINPDSTIENQPVVIRAKYYSPETGKEELTEEKVFLQWEPFTGDLELIADTESKKLYLIAVLNQSIKVMADLFVAGKNEEAKQVLLRAREQVKAIYTDAKDKDINALLRSMDEYLESFKNLAKKNSRK